ncbi:hypothetical protein [Flavobacterium sp.]|jgi:hypothetical protein|uniref:hypothetical protein n=1 Tax=Flavobacterium sp. TaxID=239 RepID=UPI0037BEC2F7
MLDTKIKNRIDWFCRSQINDFAPTISPAPKNFKSNEIESISEAVEYFLEKGVHQLVVQKKYMGSYCSIYLKRNWNESYFVSRNGYKIEHIDLELALESIKGLHEKMIALYSDFDTIIIASELLPWKVLGTTLIDKEFIGYHDALATQNVYLETSNLLEKIKTVQGSESFQEYVLDKKNLSNKEFRNKHKSHIIRQYEALQKMELPNINQQKQSLAVFKKQIDIFGKEEPVHFKPFTILKIVLNSGKEVLPNSNLTYELVNDDAFLKLDFTADNKQENINKIYDFFQKLTSENEEGIMIKSAESYIKGLPPCFKIRNNNYLTMIYGVNFDSNFEHYIDKRNVKKKMEHSINGWEINQQMLKIPYKDLNEENYLMRLLLFKRINNEEIEKTLDPRL